jgi:hypothetical protein
VTDEVHLQATLPPNPTRRRYTELLRLALNSGRVGSVRLLSATNGYLPGYEKAKDLSVRVLSPLLETAPNGKPMLPWFGDVGPTKNGHSVVLLLRYRNVRILLGGDLNRVSEDRLLSFYAGRPLGGPTTPLTAQEMQTAHDELAADIVKACHHGSGDFSDQFMEAIAPVATAVSSGDEEGYAHPRADALGAIGRTSRGMRPLIFSTELGRSSAEFHERPAAIRAEFETAVHALEATVDPSARERARARVLEIGSRLERAVAVYGAIQIRTDGRRAVVAQKIEQPISPGRKWDAYALQPVNGTLNYVRHEG